MNELISHIEFLLTRHDCVIIPGFGGFVLRYQPASFAGGSKIEPPCKIATFNAALTHNDGLLANSLMFEKKICFNEAMILIEAEVHAMQMRLQQGLAEDMGSLGLLRQGEEGELIFVPAHQNLFDLSVYGFSSVQLQPLNSKQIIQDTVVKEYVDLAPDVVLVPVNMRVLRRVCAVAVLIIGLLCVSHPLEHGVITQHYASMISSNLLKNAIVPHFSYYEEQLTPETEYLVEPETASEIENSETMPVSIEAESLTSVISEPIKEEITPMKRYYIVIGSFPSKDQAEKRISYLSRKKGIEGVQYLLKDNKYRLYINTFANKTDANDYLEEFKSAHSEFSDAWLLAHISR